MTNYMNSMSLMRRMSRNGLFKTSINQRLRKVYDFYEDFIGIKEVRKTQESVLKTESEFVDSSKQRREVQNQMMQIQEQLKQVRQKLDSTHRSDESYLTLITNEHQLIKSELQFINTLRALEQTERHLFSQFSQKLRDAHEVERLRQEKTKYLSLIGSIIGACLGIIATSISHSLKRKDFKEIAKLIEVHNLHNNSTPALVTEYIETKTNLNSEIGEKICAETQTDNYNDDKIAEIISLTESNLEYKMKVNAISTVVATYALIAITLPLIVRLFSE